ncbi:MAG: alpha/beta hydrolase [Kofleriaceae bacterium]
MRLAMLLLLLASGVASATPKRWETLPLPPEMPIAATTGHVDVKDAKIYYATYGKGAPVILLHGGLGNSDHWAFQVPDLAKHYQVIVIDSRNQGRSTFAATKVTYHAMAADVLAVMDELGLKAAAFVGWSDGGEIALDLAVNNPARVTKLFVFGANYDAKGSKPRTGTSTTFASYASKCRSDFAKISKNPKQYAAVIASLNPVWTTAVIFTKAQLRSIQAPAVIADGDHDEIIELDQIKEMAQLIPNAKLVVFPNTSHFALWQDPAAFNQAVLEFLR